MDLGIAGKVAAVAAGSKGLGRACALALAAEGVDVAICARDEGVLRSTRAEIEATGVRAFAVPLDLTDADAPTRFIDQASAALGAPDIVVCNNGGPTPGPIADFDDAAFEAALDANFMVTVRLARAALPAMREKKWGRIVAVTSAAVKAPIDGLGLSNTARAAVAGWAKSLSVEVARDGVTVNVAAPGPFETERMLALGGLLDIMREQVPVGRVGDPDEFGALVAFLASQRAAYINGATVVIDGGQARTLT